MADLLGYAFLSIPLIGAFAMFAIGISVIYRASRVLNLAHGAMAMVPAYLNHTLVDAVGLPIAVALPLSVAAGAALGVAVERVFVRRLRPQGATAQTVGTVAVTGLLVAMAAKVWGTASILAPTVFPPGAIIVAGKAVSYGDLGLLVVGAATSAGMFAFFRYTDYGLAMRGAAQNRTAAALMGIDPDRAAAVAWATGGGLAALAGILLAAVTSLDPYTLSLQVLPAFVAALLGGLESLVGAMVGAVIVGFAFGLVPALGQMPLIGPIMRSAGAPQLVLTIVALIVMVARGRQIVGAEEGGGAGLRGGGGFRRLETARFTHRMLVGFVVLILLPFVVPFSVLGSTLLAMQYSLVAISLVLLIGWVGQISLAQATFVGLGAFVTALVTRDFGLGFPFNVGVGAIIGMLAALALGAVALRVRGLYLAVATLIFAWMADAFLFRASFLGVAGGSSNIPNQAVGTPGAFPSFDLTSRRVLYFVVLAVLATTVLAAGNMRDTRIGRAFFAVRGSEMAAASLGIDVMRTKLVAFALSGLLAGLAGGMLMVEQRTVVAAQFLFTISLQYLAIAVVGGLTSLGGAVAAGVVFAALNELFFRVEALAGYLEVVSAGLLTVVLLSYPGGLAAAPPALRRHADRLLALDVVMTATERAGQLFRRADDRAAELLLPIVERVLGLIGGVRGRWGASRGDAGAASPRDGWHDWMAAPAMDGAGAASPHDDVAVHDRAMTNGHAPTQTRPVASRPSPTARVVKNLPRGVRDTLIEATGITVRFGGLTAVDNASLEVRRGEIVGLIGPNGAGKTTMFNAIVGLNQPQSGTVALHGRDVTTEPPHVRARLGVARTFQVIQLFQELTVADNLLVATHLHNPTGVLSNLSAGPRTLQAEVDCRRRVDRILELLELRELAEVPVQDLSFGMLRTIELGRALVTGAPLLMLDEAASGLNDAETDRLVRIIRDIRDLGVAVLLIEHDIRMVTGVSDHVYVLDRGKMIAQGRPADVRRNPEVITAYLGADDDADEPPAPVGAPVTVGA